MDDITNKNKSNITTADLAQSGPRDIDEDSMEEPTPEQREFASQTRQSEAVGSARSTAGTAAASRRREEYAAPLFAPTETTSLRSRWESIQVGFVDEPRRSVQQADQLVAEAIKRLAEVFADERQKLEKQWDRGDSISTEDLRLSLRRYRSFFERLLSV